MDDLKATLAALMGNISEAQKGVIRREFLCDLPAEHGLSGYLNMGGLRANFTPRVEIFVYSCYVLLERVVETAERFAQGEELSPELEPWVRETQLATAFVAFLELAAPWLAEEVDRMLVDLVPLILRPTCAPNQLVYQWFCEAFRRTMLALAATGRPGTEEVAAATTFQKAAWDVQSSTQIRWAAAQSSQIH